MTRKQLDTSREIRLWVSQLLIPATMVATTVMNNPEIRGKVANKYRDVKRSIEEKLKKS